MYTKVEYNTLLQALFDDNLLQAVMRVYEKKQDSYVPQEYEDSIKQLSDMLESSQYTVFCNMQELFRKNMLYALRFGLCEGIFAKMCFCAREWMDVLFHMFTEPNLLTEPDMQLHKAYYQRHCAIMEIFEDLQAVLDDCSKKHISAVFSICEKRLQGTLYHAFALGYQLAGDIMPAGMSSYDDLCSK